MTPRGAIIGMHINVHMLPIRKKTNSRKRGDLPASKRLRATTQLLNFLLGMNETFYYS
jgi:hypothetical protein